MGKTWRTRGFEDHCCLNVMFAGFWRMFNDFCWVFNDACWARKQKNIQQIPKVWLQASRWPKNNLTSITESPKKQHTLSNINTTSSTINQNQQTSSKTQHHHKPHENHGTPLKPMEHEQKHANTQPKITGFWWQDTVSHWAPAAPRFHSPERAPTFAWSWQCPNNKTQLLPEIQSTNFIAKKRQLNPVVVF